MTKLACSYTRRSTDDQAGSIPAQEAQISAFARTNGFRVIEQFQDDGITGTRFDRPGLNKLIKKAKQGAKWGHVLVWDRSRFGRPEDPREAIAVTYEIEKHGKKIVLLHGTTQTDNPTINTILEALEFGQAGEESIRKSRDTLRGQKQSAEKGSIPNGRIAYGYDALYLLNSRPFKRVRYLENGEKHLLSIDGKHVRQVFQKGRRVGKSADEILVLIPGDRKKIRAVQKIFREFNLGMTARSIAAQLNLEGVSSPRGGRWGRTTVLRILKNPAYKGTFAWNQRTFAKFHQVKASQIQRVQNQRKKIRQNSEAEWIQVEKHWKGLVSIDEWEKAARRLKSSKNSSVVGKGTGSVYLASGLLKCSCGSHFVGSSHWDRRKPSRLYEYYRCIDAREKGKAVCGSRSIRRQVVDDYLEARIHELYFRHSKASLLREVEKQLDHALKNTSSSEHDLTEDLSSVEEQIDRLVNAVAEGVFSADEAADRIKKLRKEKACLLSRKSKKKPRDVKQLRRKILDSCLVQLRQEAKLWPAATPEQKKQVVRAHVASITGDTSRCLLRTEFYPLMFCIHDTSCSNGPAFPLPCSPSWPWAGPSMTSDLN